jgi:hypothetical protein
MPPEEPQVNTISSVRRSRELLRDLDQLKEEVDDLRLRIEDMRPQAPARAAAGETPSSDSGK